jgi:hypothetical protein
MRRRSKYSRSDRYCAWLRSLPALQKCEQHLDWQSYASTRSPSPSAWTNISRLTAHGYNSLPKAAELCTVVVPRRVPVTRVARVY